MLAWHRLTTYDVILSNTHGKRALVIFCADSRFKAVSTNAMPLFSRSLRTFPRLPPSGPDAPDASCSGLSTRRTEIPSRAETRRLSVLLFSLYSLLSHTLFLAISPSTPGVCLRFSIAVKVKGTRTPILQTYRTCCFFA